MGSSSGFSWFSTLATAQQQGNNTEGKHPARDGGKRCAESSGAAGFLLSAHCPLHSQLASRVKCKSISKVGIPDGSIFSGGNPLHFDRPSETNQTEATCCCDATSTMPSQWQSRSIERNALAIDQLFSVHGAGACLYRLCRPIS